MESSSDISTRFESLLFRSYKIMENEDDQDSGCVSLAGIVKLQPNRRKGNKTWRPMQASDLEDFGQPDDRCEDANMQFNGTAVTYSDGKYGVTSRPFDTSYSTSSMPSQEFPPLEHLGGMYDGTDTVNGLKVFAQAQPAVGDPYVQMFGKLPDPIRLYEQMGEFDGQVVFVGHPNRDISAHQWSSEFFQWVNIGRYAHSCGKVEGSLASDRLRGDNELRDTLQYFRMAAENRELLIIQNGRPKEPTENSANILHVSTDVVVSAHTHTAASTETGRVDVDVQSESEVSVLLTSRLPFSRDSLEDPFVATTNSSVRRIQNDNHTYSTLANTAGSLDLAYRFPTKTVTTFQSNAGAVSFDRASAQGRSFNFQSTQRLPEIAFGEEAATKRDVVAKRSDLSHGQIAGAFQKPFYDRFQLLNDVGRPGSTLPAQDDVAQSTAGYNTVARCELPKPPVTVASNLSATAAPYTRVQATATGAGALESTAGTVKAPAVGLHYSDPDGSRKTPTYEVTNGLGQQAPTRQRFKGPFFTDSKPTSQDPTAALSVQISEEEKLVQWFHDGHRPARQKEYTKSLIAAAGAGSRGVNFGAIGEGLMLGGDGRFANTGPFVRLYENLSEYVEEHGKGGGQSYFTRSWKTAGPQHRGEDNTSYFGRGGAGVVLRGGVLRWWERGW